MKILIAGDYYPEVVINKEALVENLSEVSAVCTKADYSIVNYESPIESNFDRPIAKWGSCLKSNETAAEALRRVGFDCVTLANNHVLDQGERTLMNTIDTCRHLGLDTVGAGNNLREATDILYKEIDGEILAIINCCEHEFSIATEETAGSNPLNPIQQFHAIKEARQKADYVLVIVHGGHEYYQLPSPRMKETYRFFIDAGADAVVNHHQHCYSGYELYNGKPIFYGLGNFYFPKPKKYPDIWYEGFLLVLDTRKEEVSFEMHPYIQCKENQKCQLLESKKDFEQHVDNLNRIIHDNTLLRESFDSWVKTRGNLGNIFSPYTDRYSRYLCRKKLLPNFFTKRRAILMSNYFDCESHHDVVSHFLKKAYK